MNTRNAAGHRNCPQLKADKSQSNPADGNGQWYVGRDRNNKPDHVTAHCSRSCFASITVAGPPDEEFQGDANSRRSGSGPFGACALKDASLDLVGSNGCGVVRTARSLNAPIVPREAPQ